VPSRVQDQPASAQTGRGNLRLDEDHGRDAQDAIRRTEEGGLAVHAGGRGVQPGADAEPGAGEHVVARKRRAEVVDPPDQRPRNGATIPEM